MRTEAEFERHHTERTDQFRLLVESVQDYAIFLLDPWGIIRSWNLGAERIKGYKAAEIVGRHLSTFYPPEDSMVADQALEIARREGRFSGEGWRVRKDGTRFWASVVITALRESGKVVAFAKVTRDLTERRRAEEERVALAIERSRLSDTARQAQDEAAIAYEKVAVRDDFVRVAAHELRTPITAAKLGIQLMKRGFAKMRLTAGQQHALDTTEEQVIKLERLVERLLDLTRLEAGALPLELEEVDVAQLLRKAVTMWQALGNGHEIALTRAPGRLIARMDALRIEEVLNNLLDNARKYSPDGGRIEVSLAESPGEALITVRDHGLGVDPADRPRLFERFYQAHSDRSGVGLGLHISRRFVEMHGGTIRAEFPEDGGTRFVVSLPLG